MRARHFYPSALILLLLRPFYLDGAWELKLVSLWSLGVKVDLLHLNLTLIEKKHCKILKKVFSLKFHHCTY